MRLAVALLFIAVCASTSRAQVSGGTPVAAPPPWLLIGRLPAVWISVDTSRVTPERAELEVWLRFDYAADQSPPGVTSGPYRRTDLRVRLRCAAREAIEVEMLLYAADGKQTLREALKNQKWKSFSELPMVTYYEFVCRTSGVLPPGAA